VKGLAIMEVEDFNFIFAILHSIQYISQHLFDGCLLTFIFDLIKNVKPIFEFGALLLSASLV
jgi:hypothetical protein